MESILKILAAVSAGLTLSVLIGQIVRTLGFGRLPLHSPPHGSGSRGILYAFGQGMMPWEKESARKHLITYTAGFGYHFGIFSGLLYLALVVVSGFAPPYAAMFVIRVLMAAGLVFGIGLLIKRLGVSAMRSISCPDDYTANILVDLFLMLALLDSFGLPVRVPLLIESIFMILYIPVGKIRHCFFFFYSRILFGFFYGRRGVFPHPRTSERDVK